MLTVVGIEPLSGASHPERVVQGRVTPATLAFALLGEDVQGVAAGTHGRHEAKKEKLL
jgi:hypothetical protein